MWHPVSFLRVRQIDHDGQPTNSAIQGSVPRHVLGIAFEHKNCEKHETNPKLAPQGEEQNPMLLLGRPLGSSAAWVGGLLSTGQFDAHASAAAAASCRRPFVSSPLSLDFKLATNR